jgi:tRNA A37 threonylcarbamoyladenosine modification protein TsaB
MDARRQEVYGALYRSDGRDLREIIPAQVAPPEAWAQSVRECVQDEAISFLGSGVAAYPEIFADSGVDHRAHAAQLGAMVASIVATRGLDHLPDARPRYIRPSQAEVNFGPAPRHLPVDNLDPNSTV